MHKAALALAVAACSSSSPSSIALKDLDARLNAASCKSGVACEFYPDVQTCLAATPPHYSFTDTMIAAVAAHQATYDAAHAGECETELKDWDCTNSYFPPADADPCTQMFHGLVAAGGACFFSDECADGGTCTMSTTCDPSAACCLGMCTAAPARVAIGQPCVDTSGCVEGAYCSTTTMMCTLIAPAAGAACSSYDGCAPPLQCGYDLTTGKYTTCFRPAARGATCDPTQFFACDDYRDYCDQTTSKCTPLLATNATCGGSNGASCVYYDMCANTACVSRPGVGQACALDANGIANCLGGLACTNGTCQLPAEPTCM
jgi:hypothetical protein